MDDQQIWKLHVGDIIVLSRVRRVRVLGRRDGVTLCRDHRQRIAVRNIESNRLSYIAEWRLLQNTTVIRPSTV